MANQTEEICFEAIKKNGLSIRYIKNQTETMCIEALKQNNKSKKFINKKILKKINKKKKTNIIK